MRERGTAGVTNAQITAQVLPLLQRLGGARGCDDVARRVAGGVVLIEVAAQLDEVPHHVYRAKLRSHVNGRIPKRGAIRMQWDTQVEVAVEDLGLVASNRRHQVVAGAVVNALPQDPLTAGVPEAIEVFDIARCSGRVRAVQDVCSDLLGPLLVDHQVRVAHGLRQVAVLELHRTIDQGIKHPRSVMMEGDVERRIRRLGADVCIKQARAAFGEHPDDVFRALPACHAQQ